MSVGLLMTRKTTGEGRWGGARRTGRLIRALAECRPADLLLGPGDAPSGKYLRACLSIIDRVCFPRMHRLGVY